MKAAAGFARKIDWRLLLLALVITAAQITFATISGRGASWSERYRSFVTFDGGWYANILTNGYRSADPPKTMSPASFCYLYSTTSLSLKTIFRWWKLSLTRGAS